MNGERVRELALAAKEKWGDEPPADIAKEYTMITRTGMSLKPNSICGPAMTEAAILVSRRLRED